MHQNTCNSCIYYRQHYTFDRHRLLRVCCGHCTHSRIKAKRPDSPVCANYTPSPPDELAFVTKEYLSKVLLEYMLKLELLPEIKDLGSSE